MPGNEFEKQVQQKMDELKFVPSATVWQEVEKQINERKKRRLPFLWLLLLGVFLGGATWLYRVNNISEKPSVQHQGAERAVAVADNAGAEKNAATPPGKIASAKQAGADIPGAVTAGKKKAIESGNPEATGKPGQEGYLTDKRKIRPAAAPAALPATASTITPVHNKESKVVTAAADKRRHAAVGRSASEAGITKTRSQLPRHKLFNEKPAVSGQSPAAIGSVLANEEDKADGRLADNNNTVQAITPPAAVVLQDTIAALMATATVADSSKHKDIVISPQLLAEKKQTNKKKKNIQWGVSAGLGGSNISQGISGAVSDVFSASPAYSVAADRNSTQSTPGNVNNGNLNSSTRPGALKTGLSYSLNLFVSKPLGRYFHLMAALGYSYYSLGLEVGSKIDSNKALLQFSNGNSIAYTNRFHFIELPVTLQKQLGKTSRFSVNGGLAISFLAGSNALQYSSSKNIYFKDNSNINKVQLGLQAGVNYRLLQKSFMVEAGPQLSYGLSNIFNKETYGSMHLFFAGINARVYFNRNKR